MSPALRTKKETVYFVFMFLSALFLWVVGVLDILSNPNVFALTTTTGRFSFAYPVYFTLFSLLLNGVSITIIRMNGVKVTPTQLPEIYDIVAKLSKKLALKPQDTYVVHGSGVINAFATVFIRRKIVVLYSETIETLDKDELSALIAHELGHIYLGHVGFIHWFLAIAEVVIPLKLAFSRAREYSCDRVAYFLLKDTKPLERALIKIQVGRHIGQKVRFTGYLNQTKDEESLFSWFAQKCTTHPFIPYRVKAAEKFSLRM